MQSRGRSSVAPESRHAVHDDVEGRAAVERVVQRAVPGDCQQLRSLFDRYVGRVNADLNGVDTRGTSCHRVRRGDRERSTNAMAAHVTSCVVANTAGDRADEQLGRRWTTVGSAVLDRLVQRHHVTTDAERKRGISHVDDGYLALVHGWLRSL